MNISLIFIGIICIGASVHSQMLPIGFTCVPIGQCPPDVNPSTIDIRIVTPGTNTTNTTNPCPPGQMLCLSEKFCGLRNVTNVNTADGFATPGAFPWQVYLVNASGYAGSGVIVGPYTVLTVAHKVYMHVLTPQSISMYVGVSDPRQLGTARIPASITVHPMFNAANLFNDIALLRLPATSPFVPYPTPTIVEACGPDATNSTFVGQSCIVSGWGQTAFTVNDAPTMQLKQVTVTIVPYATCLASMSQPTLLGSNVNMFLDPIGEICAGGEVGKDACTQDGGSPLVCNVNGRYTVVGLVAWGKGCGQPGVYGVYVNIANYLTWIGSVFQMQGYG